MCQIRASRATFARRDEANKEDSGVWMKGVIEFGYRSKEVRCGGRRRNPTATRRWMMQLGLSIRAPGGCWRTPRSPLKSCPNVTGQVSRTRYNTERGLLHFSGRRNTGTVAGLQQQRNACTRSRRSCTYCPEPLDHASVNRLRSLQSI